MSVIVYSKPNCSKCKMLKRWLSLKNVDYVEIDILENEQGYNKIIEAGRSSLPVLEINNEFVDYNEYNDILDMI